MLTILAFFVVIGVLVFVHEMGHLIAAKSVDIEVPRFSIGFGPRIAGFHYGETEYVISALPLGGYVKMAGMEEMAALEGEAEPEYEPSGRDFDAKPLWARIWVVSAGVIMNFLFAVVVFAGVALYYGEPLAPTRVAVANPVEGEVPAAVAEVPEGAEIARVAGGEVESWGEVEAALLTAPAGPITLEFVEAPPLTLELPAGDSARARLVGSLEPFYEPILGEVLPGLPAAEAGLQPGDRIVSAGGEPVQTWSDFVTIIRAHPNEALPVVLERGGERLSITVTPDAEQAVADPEGGEIGRLGVAPHLDPERRPVGVGEALSRGVQATWVTSATIVELLGDLFTGEASPRSLGGPIAIGQLSGQAAQIGMEAFFQWMALLSINLAVLNLLPIPVLDGGQLLFLGVEAVRGRPLSLEQRLRLSHVGLIIVVGIMVWAMTNDVLRFFGI